MDADPIPEAAQEWRDAAVGRECGSVRVLSAELRFDVDVSSQWATFLDLTLPSPPPGEGTWPVDDTLLLRESLYEDARRLGVDPPWYIRLRPPDDVEAADEHGLAGNEHAQHGAA